MTGNSSSSSESKWVSKYKYMQRVGKKEVKSEKGKILDNGGERYQRSQLMGATAVLPLEGTTGTTVLYGCQIQIQIPPLLLLSY